MKLIKKLIAILKSETFIKFFIAGVTAFIVDTVILNFLTFNVYHNKVDEILGIISIPKIISSSIAVILSFVINRYWAFKAADKNLSNQIVRFLFVFFINILLASILYEEVYTPLIANLPIIKNYENLIPTIANIITTGTIMFISFFFYNNFVFNGKSESTNSK